MLVTVASFREPYEAHLFRGRLAAEGILAFVSHEMHVANKWYLSNGLGGVKVQVSSDEVELARAVERACSRGDYQTLLRAEVGDLDDPVCSHCGGTEFRKRRPFIRAALAIAFSLTTSTVLPPVGWILRCERCLREFRAPHRPFSWQKTIGIAVTIALYAIATFAIIHWYYKVFGCQNWDGCV